MELALVIGTGAGVVLDPGTTTWRPLSVRATRYSHTTDWVQLILSMLIAFHNRRQVSGSQVH